MPLSVALSMLCDVLPPTGAGAEHEGGDGAKPVPSAHPRRALPPRIPAGMPGFDGRGGGVRHGWGRRASASAGLNGRRHASFPGGDTSLVLSAFCFRLAGFPNGSGRPEQPRFWAGRSRAPDRPRYMVVPLCRVTAGSATIRKFHCVIGRADLEQGRGVLSRVTSAV